MKIVLYSRPGAAHRPGELKSLAAILERSGLEITVNEPFADAISDASGADIHDISRYRCMRDAVTDGCVAVSYGGDGTFLDCVRLLDGAPVPVLGINSGRLGFLANVPLDAVEQAFADLKNGRYTSRPSTLLEVEDGLDGCSGHNFAFNEFSLQRRGPGMISVETYIDGEMVATYWGDGVILSTPAGSTAYSLSVGGPVVAPDCKCLVLSPIAPHNLTMRPVVIPDTSRVEFRVSTRDRDFSVSLDNNNFVVRDGGRFTVGKSKKTVFLVKLQNISFYDTLRNKMLWGIDRRDEEKP